MGACLARNKNSRCLRSDPLYTVERHREQQDAGWQESSVHRLSTLSPSRASPNPDWRSARVIFSRLLAFRWQESSAEEFAVSALRPLVHGRASPRTAGCGLARVIGSPIVHSLAFTRLPKSRLEIRTSDLQPSSRLPPAGRSH